MNLRPCFPLLAFVSLLVALVAASHGQEARFFRIKSPLPVTIQNVTSDGWITWTNVATTATLTVQATPSLSDEAQWVDYVQVPVNGEETVHRFFDPSPPMGMVYIPAGIFVMGDTFDEGGSSANEQPTHTVSVSGFHMQNREVTNNQMVEVLNWAYEQGKLIVSATTVTNGEGNRQEILDLDEYHCRILWNASLSRFEMKAAQGSGHPCSEVTWYGAAAYCNYLSEMNIPPLTPCYTFANWSCNPATNGYRLPTEAEWEKAARCGQSGKRFPWGNTITHGQANYYSSADYDYDVSPTPGYHPSYDGEGWPYTAPVGSFAPNGYGLYDMTGNVWEWCGDWYQYTYYDSSPVNDPTGPSTGVSRILRGGSWGDLPRSCRAADRSDSNPTSSDVTYGFRVIRR